MKNFYFRNIIAIFCNLFKDTLKNMQVLILFIIYPVVGLFMTKAITLPEEFGGMFFIAIFATMHCIFTPLVATAGIIAEEKEKNTLRILIMSNITMPEYIIAIGSFILFLTLLTGSAFLFMIPSIMENGLLFMGSLFIGCLVSVSLGMCAGLYSKSTSAANAMAAPVGIVFAFLPMFASFNESVESIARFTYGQQISNFIGNLQMDASGLIIIAVNLIILLGTGILLYRRVKTEE